MASITCAHCGAPVTLPADLTALDAPCEFCKARTALPAEMVKLRLKEQEQLASQHRAAQSQAEVSATVRRSSSMALWITLISVALPLIITGAVMWRVFSHIGTPPTPPSMPHPHGKAH